MTEDLIRISVGTEHIDDIIGDFEQSFAAAATKPQESGDPTKADLNGDADAPAKTAI